MISALLQDVEARMVDATSADGASDNPIHRAIHHHLSAGGNRLRARICLYASVQLGLSQSDSVALSAICELLHNASLIHDDLVDRASSRRGLPSVWAAFDDATAICSGDLLLSAAFGLVAVLQDTTCFSSVLRLVHQRTRDVIIGQVAESIASPECLDRYEALAQGKSASLLSLPLELPLLLGGHSGQLLLAHRVVRAFAVAYQMADDLEDYQQDLRGGAMNAVSVALLEGAGTLTAARDIVRLRAAELLTRAETDALDLPNDCAGSLRTSSCCMRESLHTLQAI